MQTLKRLTHCNITECMTDRAPTFIPRDIGGIPALFTCDVLVDKERSKELHTLGAGKGC